MPASPIGSLQARSKPIDAATAALLNYRASGDHGIYPGLTATDLVGQAFLPALRGLFERSEFRSSQIK